MQKPKLSWNPIRLIKPIADEGSMTIEEWLIKAREFDLDYVEFYYGFLTTKNDSEMRKVRGLLDRYGLGVSMITCSPDFTHPDSDERKRYLQDMFCNVDMARILEAEGLRATIGCVHEETSREQGIEWAVDCLKKLADYSYPRGIKIGIENHYKDRRWTSPDFGFHTSEFLEVFHRLEDTPIGVNFDFSNQIMTGEDPMTVLKEVKYKVWHCHANDRVPGQYQHSVLGQGVLDFESIFAALSEIGYSGYISYEDGNLLGDEGTRIGLDFLREKIDQYWQSLNSEAGLIV